MENKLDELSEEMLFVAYLISFDKKGQRYGIFSKYLAPNNHAFLLYVNKLHSWYMCIERSGFYQTFLTSNNIHKIFFSVVKEFIIVK